MQSNNNGTETAEEDAIPTDLNGGNDQTTQNGALSPQVVHEYKICLPC